MELMRFFWDAAVELEPDAAKMDEGIRFPLCRPQALAELFTGAGLKAVETAPIDIPTRFADSTTTGGRSWAARARLPPTRCRSMKARERACGTAYARACPRARTVRSRSPRAWAVRAAVAT